MFNVNVSDDVCPVFIIGSIISYYFFRLLFRIGQSQFPNTIPLQVPRSNEQEIQELVVIVLLSYLFCKSITKEGVMTTSAWAFFLIACFFSIILGFSNRIVELRAILSRADVGNWEGTPVEKIMDYEAGLGAGLSRLILITIGVLILFYGVTLLRGGGNWMVWLIMVMMITLIYVGWILTKTSALPYQFPWWWFFLFMMILISSQETDGSRAYGWSLWTCWGILVGMMAAQGLQFWYPTSGADVLLSFLDTELFQRLYHSLGLLKTIQSSTINQVLQTISQSPGFGGDTAQYLSRLGNVQDKISDLEYQNQSMRVALQFIILVPLTLGVWWWLQSS
jgi:hypothetical protein